jgi:hypothetical protein
MTQTAGNLMELVDDEVLENREVSIDAEGVLSLVAPGTSIILSSIVLTKATSCTSIEDVPLPSNPSSPLFGFKINTVGFHWSLFATSIEERARWLDIVSKYIPSSVKTSAIEARRKSDPQRLFFPQSRVSMVENGSVFDLEEEETRPVTKFSSIDDDEPPIDTERTLEPMSSDKLMVSSSPPVMPTQKSLKQTQGITAPLRNSNGAPSAVPAVASSLPIAITSRIRQYRPTMKNTEYPADDDVEDFVQPHEKAAQTYKDYYIKTGLQLETPSASERRVKAFF